MGGSTYTPSYEGVGDNLLRADFMEAEMGRRAQKVLERAMASAPIYTGPGGDAHRGRYKESFSVRTTSHGGSKGNRAAGIVSNDAPEAVYVELGVRPGRFHPRGQPGQHILRDALQAAGD